MECHSYMSGEDIGSYLLSGNRANKKRRIRYQEGRQKIIRSKSDLEEFVAKAISIKGIEEFAVYGKVSEKLAEQVMKVSQGKINICNKYIELSSNDLWHAFNNHETAKQIVNKDLSFEDLVYALDNINNAFVERVVNWKSGKQTLELSLESGEGMIILIEIVSKSAGSICLKTGWKVDKEKYHKIYKK